MIDRTGKEVKLRDDEIERMMKNLRNTIESLKSDIYKTDSMESLDEITEAIKKYEFGNITGI